MKFLKEENFNNLFSSEEECFNKLLQLEIFYKTIQCPGCGTNIKKISQKKVYRCLSKKCSNRQVSITKNTFFYQCRMPYLKVIKLARLWLTEVLKKSIISSYSYSSQTITNYFEYFCQLVKSSLTTLNY
jgi:hypothetical protein